MMSAVFIRFCLAVAVVMIAVGHRLWTMGTLRNRAPRRDRIGPLGPVANQHDHRSTTWHPFASVSVIMSSLGTII